MFLLYVDASGTPDVPGDRNVYAMVGICVHEGTWFALEQRVRRLKSKYSLPGRDFELHAKDFCCSIREQDEIPAFADLPRSERRARVLEVRARKLAELRGPQRAARQKKYRATDPFIHLTRLERSTLLEEALDLAGSHDGIRLIGEVIDKHYSFERSGAQDVMRQAFTQVVTRFDHFLKWLNETNPPGRVDNGLLLMDREPTYEVRLSRILEEYRSQGHPWGELRHVLEAPFFVESASVSAVQLGDLCAYAVRRYVESAGTPGAPAEANFLRIWARFDRSGPRLHGLRHYCAPRSCACLICEERRRTQSDRIGEALEPYSTEPGHGVLSTPGARLA
jgi:Protein of unknown function (DUF3800)